MPKERYYLPAELNIGDIAVLGDIEHHHLAHVMRAEVDDAVELVNGQGILAEGSVVQLEKKSAKIKIVNRILAQPKTHHIILAQSLPRINRLDSIIEKGTELGASSFWLFPGLLSERKELSDHQIDRLKAVTVAAMKQSGSLYLPDIVLKPALSKWERPLGPLFFGDTDPDAPPFKQFWEKTPLETLIFFIGPESGFTKEEETILKNWGGQGVRLHSHILRTDTAAIAALTLASQWLE